MLKRIRRALRWKRKLRFYLAGPISWVEDNSYIDWREDMEKFLASIGHEAVNPLKKYLVPATDKKKVENAITKEEIDVAREYIRRRIIDPDIELLDQSDGIIANVPTYSMGTCGEIMKNYIEKKPVYIVTSMPKDRWGGWLVGLSTLIFTSWDDLKRFLKYMEEEEV